MCHVKKMKPQIKKLKKDNLFSPQIMDDQTREAILQQRKRLLQKQREALYRQTASSSPAAMISLDRFVPPKDTPSSSINNSAATLTDTSQSFVIKSKRRPLVSFDATAGGSGALPEKRPKSSPKTVPLESSRLPGNIPIRLHQCIYFDGHQERRFTPLLKIFPLTLHGGTVDELLEVCRKSYAPLGCILPEHLMCVKDSLILPTRSSSQIAATAEAGSEWMAVRLEAIANVAFTFHHEKDALADASTNDDPTDTRTREYLIDVGERPLKIVPVAWFREHGAKSPVARAWKVLAPPSSRACQ